MSQRTHVVDLFVFCCLRPLPLLCSSVPSSGGKKETAVQIFPVMYPIDISQIVKECEQVHVCEVVRGKTADLV